MRFIVVVFAMLALSVSATVCGSASGADGVHPVVFDYFLIGGEANGKWVSEEAMGSLVRGGERYKLYTLTKLHGEGVGGRVSIEAPGDTHYVEIKPLPKPGSEFIAIAGDWNALPRIPKIQDTTQKLYLSAVATILRQQGLAGSKGHLSQLLRVDLEGDGREEVLMTATVPGRDYPQVNSCKGDYSFVALRQIVKGKVETTILAGEFHKKDGEFDAPNRYEVAGVLDLNGDGVLEALVWWGYYEGEGVDVFALKNGKLVKVFSGFSGA